MSRRRVVLLAFALLLVTAVPAAAQPGPEPIDVVGPFGIGSPEADALEAELAVFAVRHKVRVVYDDYFSVAELEELVTGDDPPDLIISPQPATLVNMAPELVDLSGFINPRALRRDFGAYLIDQATVNGAVIGAPIKLALKSLVWYEPAAFEAMDYAIPTSFDELVALSDRMVADGLVPWCNYMESGSATGWMGTDWVEDLLLGAEGPLVYDQWVDHTILFQDPRVEYAFLRFQFMIDTAGYVYERSLVLDRFFFENVFPLTAGECLMHKQGSFFAALVAGFGFDLDEFSTFKFPSVDPAYADSMVGGGDYLAALNERTVVKQLVRFMLSQRFGREALADVGGWLLPNIRFNENRYTHELDHQWAESVHAALRAGTFRFDASDLMPPAVGSGSFFAGIVDLVAGLRTLPEVLADIDNSWPT